MDMRESEMGTPITDPDVIAACNFINGYHEKLGSLAPATHSPETQHAITVLTAFIRAGCPVDAAVPAPKYSVIALGEGGFAIRNDSSGGIVGRAATKKGATGIARNLNTAARSPVGTE